MVRVENAAERHVKKEENLVKKEGREKEKNTERKAVELIRRKEEKNRKCIFFIFIYIFKN